MNIQISGKVACLGNILTDTSSDDLVTILLFYTLLHFHVYLLISWRKMTTSIDN